MRRFAKVDANHAEIVAAFRACGALVCSLAAVGKGVPDLLVAKGRRVFIVEVKDGSKVPSKRKLTKAQADWHALGWPVSIVQDVPGALALFSST